MRTNKQKKKIDKEIKTEIAKMIHTDKDTQTDKQTDRQANTHTRTQTNIHREHFRYTYDHLSSSPSMCLFKFSFPTSISPLNTSLPPMSVCLLRRSRLCVGRT